MPFSSSSGPIELSVRIPRHFCSFCSINLQPLLLSHMSCPFLFRFPERQMIEGTDALDCEVLIVLSRFHKLIAIKLYGTDLGQGRKS